MRTLQSDTQIDELTNHRARKSISIIMPTYASGSQVRQNAIRFKNLVARIKQQLIEQDEQDSDVEKRLQPLYELQRNDRFWQNQSAGLAVYASGQQVATVALHDAPAEVAQVADNFYVTPVALNMAESKRCHVLALSWSEASLFLANRFEVKPIANDLFPVALRDVILPPDAEKQLQFRTQSNSVEGAMFHGQGEGEQILESDRMRFLSEVGKRVRSLSNQPLSELICVGTEEVLGHFSAVTNVDVRHKIHASPEGLTANEFNERVLSMLGQAESNAGNDELGDQLETALAASRASRDLEQVIEAASAGRIQKLLVNPQIVSDADRFEGKTRNRVNMAVIQTLQAGGELASSSDSLLGSASVAAIYRY